MQLINTHHFSVATVAVLQTVVQAHKRHIHTLYTPPVLLTRQTYNSKIQSDQLTSRNLTMRGHERMAQIIRKVC